MYQVPLKEDLVLLKVLSNFTVEDCPILPDPFDGNITCENTTDGDTCTITCNEGYRLPYKFAHVYHCGDTGSWFPSVQPIACIGKFYRHFIIGIKHGFSCIDIRQVPREVLKTEVGDRGFQHLPRDLASVYALKNHVRLLLLHKI